MRSFFCLCWILVLSPAQTATPETPPTDPASGSAHWSDLKPIVVQAHAFAETPELLKLGSGEPFVAPTGDGQGRQIPVHYFRRSLNARGPLAQRDPVVQSSMPAPNTPSPNLTFDGVNNNCACTPPDPNGAVGPSNYVSIVNVHFQVFNKFTGAAQTGIISNNALFASLGSGSLCATTDDGDPVVLYDSLADRWLISQFANASSTTGPWFMSVAISKTPDPTGGWYVYCFQTPGNKFPDYPKFGVWPDGYYLTVNQFNGAGTSYLGAGVYAFDRAKMLVGDPTAILVYFDLNGVDPNIFGMLPSSVDGPPPPVGTPNYFTYYTSISNGDAQDGLRLFQFHANFVQTNLSTFVERAESPIHVAAFTPFASSGSGDIPQSGTSQLLDSLADRLMFRLQYRNFSSNDALVVTHSVVGGSSQAAIRYYQLRRNLPSGTFGVYDQATFAPDASHRWMGSAAMNYRGDLAVGYSVSSSTSFPSIRYAARLSSDPTNQLTQGEATLIAGGGAQTGSNRWGDYTCLTVDPSDDCTFWYTDEYYSSSSATSWRTRVGSFTLPGCSASPRGTIKGTVTNSGLPVSNVVVRTTSGYFRVTDASGNYSMIVPPGSYDMSAVVTGVGTNSVTGVSVVDGGMTTQNFPFGVPTSSVVSSGATVAAESCVATNGLIDPGETVTVNFALANVGTANASNVVAILQASGGVTSPSGSQSYGTVLTGGVAVARSFSFTATGACGGSLTATLQVQTNGVNFTTLTYPFTLGQVLTQLSEKFDGVSAPSLPAGWATAASGAQSNWVTSTASVDTAPNAAFSADNSAVGVNELDSPSISITSTSAVLTFRQNYSLTASATNPAIGYDGGVLEIRIGAGSFQDILTAGGSFASGGYNTTLSSAYSNPLAGRPAWSGNSGGFTSTVVQLPAAAAGQNVQLRWRCGAGSAPTAPFAPLASSGTLAFWNFDGSTAAPTTVGAGISATFVSVGNVGGSLTFFTGNPSTGQAVASSGFTTSAGPPTTNFSFFSFALTVTNGSQASLSGISFDDRASGSGPASFNVQISRQSNFSSIIYDSGAQSTHGSFSTTPMDSFALTNAGLTATIYFRIYGYSAAGAGGTWRVDNLNIQGSIMSSGPGGWFIDTVSISDPNCCSGSVNHPPVINAASINPNNPTTTNDLLAAVTSASDPDGDTITYAYQWQESTNNVVFIDLGDQTASALLASLTVAGDYYRTIITPNDGQTNGAPFTTASVAVPVDSDGNGINDDWEVQHFGNIGVDPNADPDGDGFSNLQEYLAGTDPNSASSLPLITSVQVVGDDVVVSFATVSSKQYELQRAADIANPTWMVVATNIAGTGGTVQTTDTGAASLPVGIYRIQVLP